MANWLKPTILDLSGKQLPNYVQELCIELCAKVFGDMYVSLSAIHATAMYLLYNKQIMQSEILLLLSVLLSSWRDLMTVEDDWLYTMVPVDDLLCDGRRE